MAALGLFADTLRLLPVDDRDVFDAIDLVDLQQPVRCQFVDHGAHAMVFYGVAGEHLHADGVGLERLHAEIISEVPQADEEKAGHRRAVDDGFAGPEVGRDRAVAGHGANSGS
jgi:hypothetical protein